MSSVAVSDKIVCQICFTEFHMLIPFSLDLLNFNVYEINDYSNSEFVVRQRRSKSFCISNCRKISSSKSEVSTSLTKFCRSTKVSASDSDASKITASSSSCVSIDSVSSGIATSRDRMGREKRNRLLANEFKPNIAPAYIRRRAEAILRVLSHESASEVRIRQLIGNSPDTSKALRMLLKQGKVKRSGEGGRSDPYIYVAISP
uniref:HTH three-helical bundle domain-containing protein n=1 Tax=Nicotiana tabacum TaxID=4097 RepID=A0A1S4DIY6_TOBAC